MSSTLRGIGNSSSRLRSFSTFLSLQQQQQTPLEVLQTRLDLGELSPDSHQAKVVRQFQELQLALQQHRTPPQQQQRQPSFLSRLLRGPTVAAATTPTPGIRGVYLWGSVGGGKTMLMDLFFGTVGDNVRCSRVHYHDFMQEVHHLIHEVKKSAPPRDTSTSKLQPFDPIPPVGRAIMAKSNLICLDEFQVTDVADAMILRHLFSHLFSNGLILVATSNRHPDDLYKNGLQRSNFMPFIALLKQHAMVLQLDPGVDYRMFKSSSSSKYFFDMAENAKMFALFKFLCSKETDDVRPKTIRIKGRDVSFKKACGGVLFSDFEELCCRPLWTNDFIKIAQVFHTVFVADIPVLTRKQHRSEARRFITLIDTLYDSRVRVVASAAVPYNELFQKEAATEQEKMEENRMLADDLGLAAGQNSELLGVFSGEEELFAFDRTVSRLAEMQTEEYWQKWESKH